MMEQAKKNFNLSLAGHSFAVHALYREIYDLCEDYITDEPAENEITITEEDIQAERILARRQGLNPHNSYLETLAVYRKISEAFLNYNTFLMHGAVLAYENKAYMFTAASGTGKTTHINLWLENLENAYIVNGDKPLIRITEKEAIACGTPWCGKEKLGKNSMVPLKAIVMMERGEDNEIHEISFSEVLTFLLKQTYMPENAELMKKTLGLVPQLCGKVKFFKFRFNNLKNDAFEVAYKALV